MSSAAAAISPKSGARFVARDGVGAAAARVGPADLAVARCDTTASMIAIAIATSIATINAPAPASTRTRRISSVA